SRRLNCSWSVASRGERSSRLFASWDGTSSPAVRLRRSEMAPLQCLRVRLHSPFQFLLALKVPQDATPNPRSVGKAGLRFRTTRIPSRRSKGQSHKIGEAGFCKAVDHTPV